MLYFLKHEYLNLSKGKIHFVSIQKDKTVDVDKLNPDELRDYIRKLTAKIESQSTVIDEFAATRKYLEDLKASRGFKVLLLMYRVSGALVPPNSKRRNFIKMILFFMKHPKLYISSATKRGFKEFIYNIFHDTPAEFSNKLTTFNIDIQRKIAFVKPKLYYKKLVVPKYDKPEVSIVIPVYNQFHFTYHCIKSIIQNTKNLSYEIIIADDVSIDKTAKISKYIKNIIVNRNETNQGFLLNCNAAASRAKGRYLHFLNNDTQVSTGWLKSLFDLMERDSTIGLAGSKLIFSNGTLQEAGGIIWNDASGWNFGRGDDPSKPEYNYVKEVDYISGASIMISKSLWDEIGGFDTRYVPAYFEDSDLAFEVRKHGKRVVYQPKSEIIHFEGISHGTDVSSGIKSYQLKNKEKFIEKWENVLKAEHQNPGENAFIARERGGKKPTVLMVDHYIPTFDKDAGSRTMYHFVKLLIDAGFTVKFIGDNFGRIEPYSTIFEQMGVEILWGENYLLRWRDWIEENGEFIDFAFLARPHISMKYIDIIKTHTNAKIIYYGHDLHYLREQRAFELTGKSEHKKMSEYWKPRELKLMKKADVAFTVSSDEQRIMNEELQEQKAVVCPIFFYDDFSDKPIDVKEKKDLLFVGGFSHLPNIDAVKWFMSEIWPEVSKKLPGAKFYIVGSNPTKEIKAYSTGRVIVTGFISDEKLKKLYEKCRVCVIPLRYGAGVKGKTLEAMYHRISIVSTSIGLEGYEEIDQYILPHDSAKSFSDEVISLYKDDSKITENHNKYIEYVKNNYSYEKAMGFIKEVFVK